MLVFDLYEVLFRHCLKTNCCKWRSGVCSAYFSIAFRFRYLALTDFALLIYVLFRISFVYLFLSSVPSSTS